MKKLTFLIVLLSFLGPVQGQSSSSSHLPPSRVEFFRKLNSPILTVIDEGSPFFDEKLGDYPWLARIVQTNFFKWDPLGKPRMQPQDCNSFSWQDRVLQREINPDQWSDEILKFLKNCEDQWKTGWNDIVSNSLGMMSFKLNPNRYPYGRHVLLQLPNGVQIKGLLAMKTDQKRRPLIILRTGLFSNTQEFYPERFLFLQLFEQSPFHVLVLESSSGSEFLKHNNSFSLGGFDEGLQNFWIAKALQSESEPISKYINDVHLAGLSMGGHGVMFSALLNQMNPIGKSGNLVLQSALAMCPLLNMQETLDYHMTQSFSMDLMNYWASRRLKVLNEKVPQLRTDHFIPDFSNWIQQNYRGPLIAMDGKVPGIQLPKQIEKIIGNSEHTSGLFWKLNHYWPWFQGVHTPILVLSTQKDPIVSWFINSGRLEDGRLNLQDSNIRSFSFKEGYHCSFPIAYDWASLSNVLQTYFLKLSPGLQRETREIRVPLDVKVMEELENKDLSIFIDLKFETFLQSAGVFATVYFVAERDPSFWQKILAPKMTAHLPLSEMEFPIDKVVRTDDEASLLRRWAYQNIRARIDGADLVFSWKITSE